MSKADSQPRALGAMERYFPFHNDGTILKCTAWLRGCLSAALLFFLAAGQLSGQTSLAPAPASPSASASASADQLPKLSTPEDDAVITIDVCDPPAAGPCQTRITRKQFEEKFRTVYAGPRPPNTRPPDAGTLAHQFTQLLALSYEARKEGLDQGAEFQQQLQYVEMELLANTLQKKLRDESAHPSEQILQSYYSQIIHQFDEISVRCILIPRPARSAAAARQQENTAGAPPWPEQEDAEVQEIADNTRQQLIAGVDPDTVEKGAYEAAHSSQQPPSTQPVKWRRNVNSPAPEQAMLFSLKPGDISLPVPNGRGLTIYRLESRRTIPLAEVRTEVKALYQMSYVRDKLDAYLENVHPVLNKEYFDTEKQAETRAREIEERREEGTDEASGAQLAPK
jgi:parvulin-like peptidyl-prolyl isomerase